MSGASSGGGQQYRTYHVLQFEVDRALGYKAIEFEGEGERGGGWSRAEALDRALRPCKVCEHLHVGTSKDAKGISKDLFAGRHAEQPIHRSSQNLAAQLGAGCKAVLRRHVLQQHPAPHSPHMRAQFWPQLCELVLQDYLAYCFKPNALCCKKKGLLSAFRFDVGSDAGVECPHTCAYWAK